MYQKKEKNKRISDIRSVLSVAVLMVFVLAFTVPVKTYAEEKTTEPLPDIEIYIDVPEGYFSDRATVTFRLKTKDGSMPKIKNVKVKTGKKGTYQDVTESMALEITEDCTVHVVATDTSGRTYERSRSVQCFKQDPRGPVP